MWWLFIPLIVIGAVLVLFLLLVLLGRFRNGALLRPVIATLSKVGFMRRFFTRISTAAIERQNPDLASAIKKMSNVSPNPQAAQKALSRLSSSERQAYMEMAQQQQESSPELLNRQHRRKLQQQQTRGGRPGGGGTSSGARKRKKR